MEEPLCHRLTDEDHDQHDQKRADGGCQPREVEQIVLDKVPVTEQFARKVHQCQFERRLQVIDLSDNSVRTEHQAAAQVKSAFGVELEWEVRRVGEFG